MLGNYKSLNFFGLFFFFFTFISFFLEDFKNTYKKHQTSYLSFFCIFLVLMSACCYDFWHVCFLFFSLSILQATNHMIFSLFLFFLPFFLSQVSLQLRLNCFLFISFSMKQATNHMIHSLFVSFSFKFFLPLKIIAKTSEISPSVLSFLNMCTDTRMHTQNGCTHRTDAHTFYIIRRLTCPSKTNAHLEH